MEVLDAYESISLTLRGNATHLAPWHAKLGFQSSAPVAALRSLTGDGGSVPIVELIVVKLHPIAYVEFEMGESGQRRQKITRQAAEENQAQERWKVSLGT